MIGFLERIIMEVGKVVNKWRGKRNEKRAIKLLGCIIIYSVIILAIIPVYESLIPEIVKMEGVLYSGEGVSKPEHGIIFWGNNFSDVDLVYIDGRKNDDCRIISNEKNKVVLDIPQELYAERESFTIQVAKRIGGIYLCRSKKYEVQVSEPTEDRPEITKLSKDVIYRFSEPLEIIATVEDLGDEIEIYVEGTKIENTVSSNGNAVVVSVVPAMYSGKDYIEIVPATDLGGGQKLYGSAVELKIEDQGANWLQYEHSERFAKENVLIMQGAGEWQGHTGTNCTEAFLNYYDKGCRAFEVDLFVTDDGVVAGHNSRNTNHLLPKYEEICNAYEEQTPLTWEDMLRYLAEDPELYFVTETKYENETAAAYLFGKMVEEARGQGLESALDRIVVQFRTPQMYQKLMDIYPFQSVMYMLPQLTENREEVLNFIENSNVRMVALQGEGDWDRDVFRQELIQRGCYVYAYTVNDTLQAADYMARGCRGVYTDRITVEQLPEIEENISGEKERNRQFLLEYLGEIRDPDYLVLMSVQDEARGENLDDDIAQALTQLGVSEDYRYAFGQSYLGIMSGGKTIYEAFSEEALEYVYMEEDNYFRLKSAGSGVQEIAGITVNGDGREVYERGLHITVFHRKLGVVLDRIVFDLYGELWYINY